MAARLRLRRATLGFLVALTLALAVVPRAGAFVYWSQGFAIGRANLDGSDLRLSWIPIQPYDTCGVAVDASHIYWSGLGAIGRANLDGTSPDPKFIPAPNNSCGIAVDGSHVYWANRTAIGRANLDGSGNDPNFIPNAALFISGIAVDGSHIYWGNNGLGAIGRAELNGGNAQPAFIGAPGDPCAVAIDSSRIYWSTAESSFEPSGVFAADLSGKNIQMLINAPTGCGVAVNSDHLYWSTESPRAIGRASLDGSSPNFSFIADGASASGIALDSLSSPPPLFKKLPNTMLARARVSSKTHSATFRFRAVGQSSGFQCALVRMHSKPRFKRCSSPKTYRGLKPGKYTFEVRALGPGGPDPSPAKRKFRIA